MQVKVLNSIPDNIKEEIEYLNNNFDSLTKKQQKRLKYLVEYFVKSSEFDPYILSNLGVFKSKLEVQGITNPSDILKFRKDFMAVNQPKLSLLDLINYKYANTDRFLSDQSFFFQDLKTIKPEMYQYAVKKFEADFNKVLVNT